MLKYWGHVLHKLVLLKNYYSKILHYKNNNFDLALEFITKQNEFKQWNQ